MRPSAASPDSGTHSCFMSACPPECSRNIRSPWKEERKRSGEEAGGRERREEEGKRAGRHSERKTGARTDEAPAGLSVLVSCQVLICANLKGSTIKPGSMGKACAPYDVQVGGLSQPSVRRAKPTSRCARAGEAGGSAWRVAWLRPHPHTALPFPTRLWTRRATSCLREKRGTWLSASDPSGLSASFVAIW